ncbi:MAG: TIGR04282 family arsenosugar biosynthesis glycosyltransferase [Balneolaceae bacterium]
MKKENVLIIFIKNPEPGKVKTRLGASIGEIKAYRIYKKLLEHTRNISLSTELHRQLWYSSFVDHTDEWNPKQFEKHLQKGKDLGERMKNAFEHVFNEGYKHVVIIGSDCPELTPDILEEAFETLKVCDIVIGPSEDGGYYLLGMNQFISGFFTDINWSTNTVFDETIQTAAELDLHYRTLPVLNDIDNADDLIKSDLSDE